MQDNVQRQHKTRKVSSYLLAKDFYREYFEIKRVSFEMETAVPIPVAVCVIFIIIDYVYEL